MEITKRSPISGMLNTIEIDVTEEQLFLWKQGRLIQKVMPHLSDDHREFLISGMTPKEFKKMFGNKYLKQNNHEQS